jgi:hypothetical protein
MTEEILPGVAVETAAGAAVETATGVVVLEAAAAVPEKCTRSPVLTAVLRRKFRSNQLKDGRFTAEIAFLITGSSKFEILNVKCCSVIYYITTYSTFYSVFYFITMGAQRVTNTPTFTDCPKITTSNK